MTDKTPRPLDQAPASDPALDAVRELAYDFESQRLSADEYEADLATIRDALADRITPAEARLLMDMAQHVVDESGWEIGDGIGIIARLGRIADRETGR